MSDLIEAARRLAELECWREQSISLLQAIVRNDETYFEHHQPRSWDGRLPGPEGTIWLTPKEMAIRALRSIGADIPDAIKELLKGDAT